MKKVVLFLLSVLTFSLQNISAQDGIKIVTNHPDLNLKVKRCAASGTTVILDLVLNNVGVNDVEDVLVNGGNSGSVLRQSDVLPAQSHSCSP